MTTPPQPDVAVHEVSVVCVYQGERHLGPLLAELAEYTQTFTTPAGSRARIGEVILVFDHGPDESPRVMRVLGEKYDFVRTLWLEVCNFGQHAATLAGMSSSGTGSYHRRGRSAESGGDRSPARRRTGNVGCGCLPCPGQQASARTGEDSTSRGAKWFTSHLAGATDVTKFEQLPSGPRRDRSQCCRVRGVRRLPRRGARSGRQPRRDLSGDPPGRRGSQIGLQHPVAGVTLLAPGPHQLAPADSGW